MNKTLIFRKIGGIISEISEQYQYLAADPENINPLELELFVANSHFLSEHLAILKKLYAGPETPNVTHFPRHVQVDEPLLSMNIPELENNHQPADLPKMDVAASFDLDAMNHEQVDAEQHQVVQHNSEMFFKVAEDIESPSIPVVEESPASAKETTELPVTVSPEPEFTDPIIETVKEVKSSEDAPAVAIPETNPETEDRIPTLNEILSAGKKTETVSLNITQNQEKDLKSMIKLNDKLMFVRDLFNGYSLAYSEAIDFINRLDSFEAAEKFLKNNYAEKNKWAEKQNSVDKFYEVLARRFG